MRDRWLVFELEAPRDEVSVADAAAALLELGGSAVEEVTGRLRTYLPPPESGAAEDFVADVAARLSERLGWSPRIEWRWAASEDWAEAWKKGLLPRRVGARVVIAPSWSRPTTRAGDVIVRIDPGMAFGTAEHATTRGVLRLLQECLVAGDRVLDVGTGTGILAMAALGLGAGSVLALDSDPDAVETARINLQDNAAKDIELRQETVTEASLLALGRASFDVVAANVLSGMLVPLLPAFREVLAVGGRVILAGILETESGSVRAAAEQAGFRVMAEDREQEWWATLLTAA